jgi:flagellar basal-body rod protein FlgF
MIKSINTLNKSMNVLQKKQETTSHNLANVNTPGFKYQDVIQRTQESHDLVNFTAGVDRNQKRGLGEWIFGNEIEGFHTNFQQGGFVQTDDPFDYVIAGEGYFTIQLPDGEQAYTRNGSFSLDQENRLVTMEGYQVVGVAPNGQAITPIFSDSEGNLEWDISILITGIPESAELERMGETLFRSVNNEGEQLETNVIQGYLEMSNVSVSDEMVKLIQVAREFEANQKALATSDETLNKAVNEIGRV